MSNELLEKIVGAGLVTEIKDLEKRKSSVIQQIDSKIKEQEEIYERQKSEIDKERRKMFKDVEDQKTFNNNELNERSKKIDKRENDIVLKEKELLILNETIERFKKEKNDFELEKKSVEETKISYMESKNKADLLIEQYTKKLEEIGTK